VPGGRYSRDLMTQPVGKAYEYALKALGRQELTESQLAERLVRRGVEEDERAEVIDRLLADGLLDDERFARRYTEDKRELAGWGPERIREALLARGVARDLVEAALEGEGETEQLRRAVAMLEDRGLRCDSDSERERALRLLVRRGYALELAYEAVRAAERASAEAA
jgi:regulatory protein